MKSYKIVLFFLMMAGFSLIITSCQKMERPGMRDIIPDPTPPAYNPLKSFWQFENNTNDEGENKLRPTAVNLTYGPGISGQAVKVGAGGYLLLKAIGDTVTFPNEYVEYPADTLINLGSFTLSFWLNGTGPIDGGAQGLFAISNKNEFWGNLEVFLENWNNAADPNEAFLKIHLLNAAVPKDSAEQWNEIKIPNLLGKWSHVAITYNASTSQLSVYANGQPTGINNKPQRSGTYGKIRFDNFNGMVLGSYAFQTTPSLTNHGPESWAKSFNGSLDQFRLYNRALSAAEVTDLFTSKK